MALKDWMIAFNNAKELEANGEDGPRLIAEYKHVLEKMGEGPFTEAEQHVREEALRNLDELYALNGNEPEETQNQPKNRKCNSDVTPT